MRIGQRRARRIAVVLVSAVTFLSAACGGVSAPAPVLASDIVCARAAHALNPIVAENTCPGTRSWLPDHPMGPEWAILGFAAPESVQAGGEVQLFVSTRAPSYTFRVFRLGWYQGLGARLMYSSPLLPGIQQPLPRLVPHIHMVTCDNWTRPVMLPIPSTWVSGIYVVKLLSSAGLERYTYFIVHDDASHAAILFQTSTMTAQAYNAWGGYSLYQGLSGFTRHPSDEVSRADRAYSVSFDRPYGAHEGLGDVVVWEYPLLRWMEREGYDLTYATDVEVDREATLAKDHRLVVVGGHDEYWTEALRDHLTVARDTGTSLAFMGANDGYWRARLEPSALGPARVVVCYRFARLDPVARINSLDATVRWRDPPLNRPEDALLGEMYAGMTPKSEPMWLAPGAAPFLAGTGLSVGTVLPGLVGYEYDRVYDRGMRGAIPADSVPVAVIAASPVGCSHILAVCTKAPNVSDSTLYMAASGALVFDAGTLQWSWGLDDTRFDTSIAPHEFGNAGFQRLTRNIIAYLLTMPAPGGGPKAWAPGPRQRQPSPIDAASPH